jgi:nitrate/TMAO reductase-like tetraheme cytochrome c subunit
LNLKKGGIMKKTITALAVGLLIGIVVAYISAILVDKTSKPEFCASCHTMKPMVESFKISVHGANNKHGYSAEHCTDCHLPHNSLSGYLAAKAATGLKDTLGEMGLTGKVDFERNYWEMKKYVYDSACLKCHQAISDPNTAYGMSKESVVAHNMYWNDKKQGRKISCTSCHNDYITPGFAHPELLERLGSK